MSPTVPSPKQLPSREAEAPGTEAGAGAAVDWPALLASVIAGEAVTAVYQPIIDVTRGVVVGYEALARFTNPTVANPEDWFEAARQYRISDQLEAATITAAFAYRDSLPVNCFLAVNVSPDELAQPVVRSVLDRQGDLSGVVIELTEQARIESYLALEPHLDRYRAAGALIAVDDAGSGYAGLRHLLSLRPAIIKLDRHFIDGIDQSEAKRALVEMLGTFADRTNCWILAEGVERSEELDVLVKLNVPLAQGYLLGRPAPPWAQIEPGPARQLRHRPDPVAASTLRALVEASPAATSLDHAARMLTAQPHLEHVVILDEHDRPAGVADVDSVAVGVTSEVMSCTLDTPTSQAARRSISRPRHNRLQPLVCVDDTGRYTGIVTMERLIAHLAQDAATGGSGET
jgi:EAL domain-containing protein (putative c-di-GMP-specific phosphodiesterase class I)